MKPLNILHTISVPWWNACAYYAILISKGLQSLNQNIQLYSDRNSPPYKHSIKNNIPTKPFNFKSIQPLNFIKNYYSIKTVLRNENIQIVNCHRPEDHLLMGVACKQMNIPLVRTVGDIRPPAENPINEWLHLKATDFFIFSSESNLTRFASAWPEIQKKSVVIYGGLEIDQFSPSKKSENLLKELGFSESDKIVGFIGRLSKTKDIPSFVNAARLIIDKLPDTKFIISGDEVSVSPLYLEEMSKSMDISDSIRIIDRHPHVQELISILDVGVITSKDSEAICRIGMEYMSMGKPVVATDVNVLPEIIQDKRNGFITNTEDPHAIAEGVIKLLTDDNLFHTISQNNLDDSNKNFDHIKEAEKTLSIYNKLIEN